MARNESSTCPSCKAPAHTLVRHVANADAPAEVQVVQIAAVDNRQRGYHGIWLRLRRCRRMPIGAKRALFAVRAPLFRSTASPPVCSLPHSLSACFVSCRNDRRDDDPNGDLLCDACGCTFHVACLPDSEQADARRLAHRANAGKATPDWFCPVCVPVHAIPPRSPSLASPRTCSASSGASPS